MDVSTEMDFSVSINVIGVDVDIKAQVMYYRARDHIALGLN